MSFDTHAGTRGGRQPAGWFFRWMNRVAASRIRCRRTASMMGFNVLILTTIGRRSGEKRVNPVGWFPGGDGSWLIVASANGAVGNPAWYYNIAADPEKIEIEVGGHTLAVAAEQLHGVERTQAWEQVIAAAPRFAQYQRKTDREIPIIRLVPRPDR